MTNISGKESITPKEVFLNRRRFIKNAALSSAALATVQQQAFSLTTMVSSKNKNYESVPGDLAVTDEELMRSYTNFYEFGLEKNKDPDVFNKFKISPWELEVGGLVDNPMKVQVEELISDFKIEERVYRLRCVETWSAVVPWIGFPLRKLIEKVKPKANAKYIRFDSFFAPHTASGQSRLGYPWPYREGLRLDEGENDLALIGLGMYGENLDKPNGAPIRLVVPWKYGFKSIKSIKKIEFVAEEPETLWNQLAPSEYGFYANVNPEVHHPRWSQAKEKPLGQWFGKVPTLKFNGYEKEVGYLYKNMDLKKYY